MSSQPSIFDKQQNLSNNPSIKYVIDNFKAIYKADFDAALVNWKDRARNFVKDKTALKLQSESSASISIPVATIPDIFDGFTLGMHKLFPDLDIFELIALQNYVVANKSADKYFLNSIPDHARLLKTQSFATKRLKKFDPEKIIKQLFDFFKTQPGRDILGCYYYSKKIEIFYVPIVIFCEVKKISFDSLFAVVLAHEWAHAYHHNGRDTDGNSWENFKNADIDIKEGLAQYYTEKFVNEFSSYNPQLKKAYEALLSCQSGPYLMHKKFIDVGYEGVRNAILTCRDQQITDFKTFVKIVRKNK